MCLKRYSNNALCIISAQQIHLMWDFSAQMIIDAEKAAIKYCITFPNAGSDTTQNSFSDTTFQTWL